MGIPGVPINISVDTLDTLIRKYKGKTKAIAEELKCCRRVIREQIEKEPYLIELQKEMRYQRDEDLLEESEDTLEAALKGRTDDMSNALKSAFYVLNQKGKARGYQRLSNNDNDTKQITVFVRENYADNTPE